MCRNPLPAHRRTRKRQELIEATQGELERIAQAVSRPKRPLRGKDFELNIGEDCFSFRLPRESVEREAELDGLYALRTNIPAQQLDGQEAVGHFKGLSEVESAFRSLKTAELRIRPIHDRLADRVRAHVLPCMLAYYVQWHMRRRRLPCCSTITTRKQPAASAAPTWPRPSARARDSSRPPASGPRTLTRPTASAPCWPTWPASCATPSSPICREPSPLQQRVFELLKARL